MKSIDVKVAVVGADFGYGPGRHDNVPDEIADELVRAGHADHVGKSKKKSETATNSKAEKAVTEE